jgi:signal transduction histidine kinase
MLSLMLRNLPVHYDNPAFREDALRVISQSVSKLNTMCSRLSLFHKKLELYKREVELNTLVADTLASLNGCIKAALVQNLRAIPRLSLDPEQMQKVLTNLIFNAQEAVDINGEICLETEQQGDWVVLTVRDNGCGMTKEFIAHSLFKPFHTTKKQGLGIGLFQSKMIIEAHQGKIEVESEEGKGTTFRILLPAHTVH